VDVNVLVKMRTIICPLAGLTTAPTRLHSDTPGLTPYRNHPFMAV
jgi:hypothetical protein